MWPSLCSRSLLRSSSESCLNVCSFHLSQYITGYECTNQPQLAGVETGLSSTASHGTSGSACCNSSSSSSPSWSPAPVLAAAGHVQQLWQLHSSPLQPSRALSTSTCQHQQQQQQLNALQSNTRQQPLLHIQQALPQLLQQQRLQQQAGHQLQQQRGVKQLRPYGETPKLPPKFRRPDKDGRMNRMVIRIPPQVQVAVENGQLVLTGKAGSTSLDLSVLDPTGLVAWQCFTQSTADAAAGPGTGSLLLMCSPSKRHWRSIQTHVNNAVHGVMQGYLVGLNVQGVGYRLEPVSEDVVKAAIRARRGDAAAEDSSVKRPMFWEQEAEKTNIAYPHKQPAKAVRLKVGFTKAAIFPLPDGVLGLCVKPSLMYLYGVDKHLVTNTAAAIRAVRKPNAYTGNGIQLVGETIKLKQRAGSK